MSDVDDHLTRRLSKAQGLTRLVGEAPAFRAAIEILETAAQSDAPVLIGGETGTGKELIARALHYLSGRAAFPFVAINCGSLTETLLADELFGHERGAFTDAHQPRVGLVAHADRGTLFLDEVDALTPRGQVALLRLLQDRSFRPLGSNVERSADVRFLSATNTPLLDQIAHGTFRADLYYRLTVFTIALPPLRERGHDVILLARHFLRLHAPAGRVELSAEAESALLAHAWPGNARELENVIVRATRLCKDAMVRPAHLGLSSSSGSTGPTAPIAAPLTAATIGRFKVLKADAMRAFERDYLERLLAVTDGNVTRAAAAAGKERRDLGRLLKKYRIQPDAFAKRRA